MTKVVLSFLLQHEAHCPLCGSKTRIQDRRLLAMTAPNSSRTLPHRLTTSRLDCRRSSDEPATCLLTMAMRFPKRT